MLLAPTFSLLLGLAQAIPSPAGDGTTGKPDTSIPGFVWRGETFRKPEDVRRDGGMWARGFQSGGLTAEQLEQGSSLYAHVSGGTREHTQYVSTTASLDAALNFAVRPNPEHAHEPGYIYRIRTNWAMVDVNLSLENICPFPWQHEHAAVQGIPWNQIMGWYSVTTADVNRILGADDRVSQMGAFTRNPDFHPDATYPGGSQPQLAGLQMPVEGRRGAWEPFVGQSATENLRAFVRDHGPQTDATTLRRIHWPSIPLPNHLRATIAQGAASSAQCALAAAAVMVSFRRHDELKRSISRGQLLAREDTANLDHDNCRRLAAVAKAKLDNEKPTVKACDSPRSQGECTDLEAPAGQCVAMPFPEWNDRATTVRPSVAAGICKFFRDYDCAGDGFEVSYPGNDNLDKFSDGYFNDMISSFRCKGAGAGEETQIERPPTATPQQLPGVHVCEGDGFHPSCRRFPAPEQQCADLPGPWDSRATSIRPERDAGACKFYLDKGCKGQEFETAFPGVDLYADDRLASFNDKVKSFRCDGSKKAETCEPGREPVKCTPSLQSPVAPADEWLYIRACCAKSTQTEADCCRSQIQWLDVKQKSEPFIAPDGWYKSCTIGSLTVDVQLANVDWAGSEDRLFLEIGHSSKWDGGQPHYLLKASPGRGDTMSKEIDLGDAFDKDKVTAEDVKHVGLASRVDNGGLGTDKLKLQDMTLSLKCAGTAITAQVRKTHDEWFTFWTGSIQPADWVWDLASKTK